MEITFPTFDANTDFNQTRRVIVRLNAGSDSSSIGTLEDGTIAIFGVSTANSGGIPENSDYGNRFVIGLYGGENGDKPLTMDSVLQSSATSTSAWIDLKPEDALTQKITLRLATSFISSEQALTNLKSEVSTAVVFEEVMEESRGLWNTVLSRVSVDEIHSTYTQSDQTDLYTTFYSSLYRASLFPRQLSEYDEDGNEVHWSPFSTSGTRVFDGPISTDSGFWDAYSTVCKSIPYLSPSSHFSPRPTPLSGECPCVGSNPPRMGQCLQGRWMAPQMGKSRLSWINGWNNGRCITC